jgi:hypothetical protein
MNVETGAAKSMRDKDYLVGILHEYNYGKEFTRTNRPEHKSEPTGIDLKNGDLYRLLSLLLHRFYALQCFTALFKDASVCFIQEIISFYKNMHTNCLLIHKKTPLCYI